ncbi:MAG: tetratricopeptide repeat protein [Mariniphaga sp.]|nr:tetratricopeptide repeat protein [Mariniphaga sp.]
MKQIGEKVVLAIPGKNKIMGKVKYILIIVIAGFLFSCSSTKQSTVIQEENLDSSQIEAMAEESQSQFQYFFVEGLKQKMLGNLQEAIRYFSGCLELDPNSAAAMYELANIHASNNDFTSASLLLEKAVSISPENKWYKMMLARIYQQTRKFDQAAIIYNDLISLEPDNLDYLYLNALMLSGAGKLDDAIDAYKKIEKKVGINEQISVSVQQLLVDGGKIKEAFAEIQKLIDSNPQESKYYGLLADLHMSQGEIKKALENYNKILEMDPENGFVHFSLANYYLDQSEVQKSFEHTKKGFLSTEVDIDTKLQLYLMFSGNSVGSQLSDENIGELVDILVNSDPEDHRVYMVYAEQLIRKNSIAEAREQLRKALALNNTDYLIWERLLIIDNDIQDWQALYDDSEEALFLFPNQPQVYFLHGIACLQLEKNQEVLDICSEGMVYVIENPDLEGQMKMLQGEAHYKMENFEQAFALFDEALESNPDNYIALNNYAYYLSIMGINLDKAERMSGRVIQLFPDNSTYLDTHAWVLFKKKNYQLAKFYMESAINNGGEDNPVLLEHYGDILIMLEETSQAKEFWQKAKEKGSESSLLDQKIKDLKYYENKDQ